MVLCVPITLDKTDVSNNNCKVGINGNTVPGYTLDVNGDISTTSLNINSDDRIKSRSTPIQNGLDILLQLTPIKYEKHPDFIVTVGVEDADLTNIKHFPEAGFNAQDIEQISELSYIVSGKGESGLKSVNYTNLIAYLVSAIKEQTETIVSLTSRIEILET